MDVDDDSNRDLLSPAELRLARDKIDSLILYLDHYREYKKNKADYYNAIKNVRENQCILSADFKQKIPIGHKLAEQSWVFRKLKLRNCLGIILQFKRKKLIFDVITNITNQTSLLSTSILDYVLHHPDAVAEFVDRGITDLDCWYDVGSHFCNKSLLHFHFYDVPDFRAYKLNHIGCRFHSGKHGKSDVDGHFGFVSSAVEEANDTVKGVQDSGDIVTAIVDSAAHRNDPKDGIEYRPTNFDTNGPLRDCPQMKRLTATIPREKILTVTQLKAFKHYVWKREKQDTELMTEREELSLPSLRTENLNKTVQVNISRSHLIGSQSYETRNGWTWRNATKSKVDTNIEIPELKTAELKRRIGVRALFQERYDKGEPVEQVQDQYISEPDEMSEDEDESEQLEPMTVSQLEDRNWKQLNELCKKLGLKSSGKKSVLKARLLDPNNENHRKKKKN